MSSEWVRFVQSKVIVKVAAAYFKKSDMESEMLTDTQDLVTSAIDKYTTAEGLNLELASRFVKDGMDKQYGAHWHCIIGEGFGFDVTSQGKATLFMYYGGNLAILVFKG